MKCTLWTETLEFSRLKVPNSRFALHGLAPPQFTVCAPFLPLVHGLCAFFRLLLTPLSTTPSPPPSQFTVCTSRFARLWKLDTNFFSQIFRAHPGYPGKIPGYPAPKVWVPWFRGTYRTFWPPPVHVEDPYPTGKYPDQKVSVWVFFLPDFLHPKIGNFSTLWEHVLTKFHGGPEKKGKKHWRKSKDPVETAPRNPWKCKSCFSNCALVKTFLRFWNAFKHSDFEASKLVSTKSLLLKPYYRRQGNCRFLSLVVVKRVTTFTQSLLCSLFISSESLPKFTGERFTNHSNHIHIFTPITQIVDTKVLIFFANVLGCFSGVKWTVRDLPHFPRIA